MVGSYNLPIQCFHDSPVQLLHSALLQKTATKECAKVGTKETTWCFFWNALLWLGGFLVKIWGGKSRDKAFPFWRAHPPRKIRFRFCTPPPPTRCTERLDTQWIVRMSTYRKRLGHNIYASWKVSYLHLFTLHVNSGALFASRKRTPTHTHKKKKQSGYSTWTLPQLY